MPSGIYGLLVMTQYHANGDNPFSASFVEHLCYFVLVLLCFHDRLFVDALWTPIRKGLKSWLSFVMSHCDVVTFVMVSWVSCVA